MPKSHSPVETKAPKGGGWHDTYSKCDFIDHLRSVKIKGLSAAMLRLDDIVAAIVILLLSHSDLTPSWAIRGMRGPTISMVSLHCHRFNDYRMRYL